MGPKTKREAREEFQRELQRDGAPGSKALPSAVAHKPDGHSSAGVKILERQAGGLLGQVRDLTAEVARLNAELAAAGSSDPTALAAKLGLSVQDLQPFLTAFQNGYILKAIEPSKITKLFLQRRSDKHVHGKEFMELVESIKAHGQKVPAYVRPLANGEFELIVGRRRRDAVTKLGLHLVSFVKEMGDLEALNLQRIENEQRINESAWELGSWYSEQLKRKYFDGNLTALAAHYDANKSDVSEMIKMLTLPKEVVAAFSTPEAIKLHWSRGIFLAIEDDKAVVIEAAKTLQAANAAVEHGDEFVYKTLTRKPTEVKALPEVFRDIKVRQGKKKLHLYRATYTAKQGVSIKVNKKLLDKKGVNSLLDSFEAALRKLVKDIP